MADCLQCGESPAKNVHLEYPGDRLCDPCYVALCEELYEQALDNLKDAVKKTGVKSYTLDDLGPIA